MTTPETDRAEEAIRLIIREYNRAISMNGAFHSAHEGYAVILEELDELWEQVRLRDSARDVDKMRKEAAQIGAMALRFIVDVC